MPEDTAYVIGSANNNADIVVAIDSGNITQATLKAIGSPLALVLDVGDGMHVTVTNRKAPCWRRFHYIEIGIVFAEGELDANVTVESGPATTCIPPGRLDNSKVFNAIPCFGK